VSRQQVRTLKRALRRGADHTASAPDQDAARASALALLARSLQMGHVRLALLRLHDAVACGAPVLPAQWQACRQIAMVSADLRCLAIYAQAWRASLTRPAQPSTPCRGSSGPADRAPASGFA